MQAYNLVACEEGKVELRSQRGWGHMWFSLGYARLLRIFRGAPETAGEGEGKRETWNGYAAQRAGIQNKGSVDIVMFRYTWRGQITLMIHRCNFINFITNLQPCDN